MGEQLVELQNGFRVWTKIVGGGSSTPLLLLHGGPGAGHDYLEPLEGLARDRPVIFYDQLGCGRSDKPDITALWTIERFADEVEEVRAALGLTRCHILGQSAGGWLAIEYMARRPVGVASLVLASTSASIPEFMAECTRLIGEMPENHRNALMTFGPRGEYEHPDYAAALNEFYARHLCRLPEWPDCLMRTVANIQHNKVYATMNGPNEFTILGNMRYWDRTDYLDQINLPVLITCGRHDELGPACAATLQSGIKKARTEIFEKSAHLSHIEETEDYLRAVGDFLAAVDHQDGLGH